MNLDIEVILFDLGGVLVELGKEPIPSEWLSNNSQFDLSDWFSSETAILFEKGLITPLEFAERLKKDLSIAISTENLIEHFTRWPKGVFDNTYELLKALQSKYRLAVLSNTNELHWPRVIDEFKISNYFEYMYASHKLHMAKPDLIIFEYVANELGVEPNKILFLDDNEKNIEVAKQSGMHGIQVMGINQVKLALGEIGIVHA